MAPALLLEALTNSRSLPGVEEIVQRKHLREKGTHLCIEFTSVTATVLSSHHYGGRFLHLDAVTTQGWSSQVFHCHRKHLTLVTVEAHV